MANKLELTWYGKEDLIKMEPRLLIENEGLSNTENNSDTENMLIHGDNLLALKALLPKYEGKVKCIYIDPPYNTGSVFEQYDDNLEHSIWLSLMRPRKKYLMRCIEIIGFGSVRMEMEFHDKRTIYAIVQGSFHGHGGQTKK